MLKDLLSHCTSEHTIYKEKLIPDDVLKLEIKTDGTYYDYGPVLALNLRSKSSLLCGVLDYGELFFWLSMIGSDKDAKAFDYNLSHTDKYRRYHWNLTSKKSSTETKYGVWKLLSCSFTYQSKKNPIP